MSAQRHHLRSLGTALSNTSSVSEASGTVAFSALLVLHSGGIGGAGRAAVAMGRHLVARGVALRVVVADDARDLVPELRSTGVEVLLAEPRLSWWTLHDEDPALAVTRRDVRFDSEATTRIVRELTERPVDLVITQSSVIPHGAYAAAARGLPHVWMVAEIGDPAHGASLPFEGAELGAVVDSLSDLVVAPSVFVKASLDLPAERTIIVPPPIDGTGLTDIAPRTLRRGALRVISIGSLTPAKGHADAIAGLAELASDMDVHLRIIGSGNNEQREELERCILQHAMERRVTIEPLNTDRGALYADADIVVVASRNEAFGLVAHEAALAGRPVVFAASGGVAETMTDGVTGLAFPVGDTAALAEQLRRLVDDSKLRDDLIATARTAATSRADDTGPSDDLFAELDRLARTGPRPDTARSLIAGIVRSAVMTREEAEVLSWRLAALLDRRVVALGLRLASIGARLRRRSGSRPDPSSEQ